MIAHNYHAVQQLLNISANMGVRRLQTYLEKHCPDACYEVKIKELADHYKMETGLDPVIVVDGSSCIRPLYANLDWVCGGQCKEYADTVRHFINCFQALGIKLIFYFDGSTQASKRCVWVNRRLNSMDKAHAAIDQLKSGCNVCEVDREHFTLPCGIGNTLSTVAKDLCEVRRSVRECDEEIAEYAAEHQCFAILSQDSDFVIYKQCAWYYLSSEKLNLADMTTLLYDKFTLARSLHLTVDDLPVLATLMGNDFVSADDLRQFHYRITGKVHGQPYAVVLVRALAAFLQKLPKGNKLFTYLPTLSRQMFRSPARADDLKQSILGYDTSQSMANVPEFSNDNWGQILHMAFKWYIDKSMPSEIYAVMRGLPYEMSTSLEDYRSQQPAAANVLRPMRQKIYGIILREKGEGVPVVEEWCVSGLHSLDQPALVPAILPPASTPGLLELWQGESFANVKMLILIWIASEHLSANRLNVLPIELVPAACILSYLYHDAKVLEDWEVQVFAAVTVELQASTSQQLSLLNVDKVDLRGVQLAVLYMRAIHHLSLANAVCGHPIPESLVKHHQLFDGKLFQIAYLSAKRRTPMYPKPSRSSQFASLCNCVFG